MRDERDAPFGAAEGVAAESVVPSRRRRWLVGIGLAILAAPALLLVLVLIRPEATGVLANLMRPPRAAGTQPPAMFADQLAGARGADKAETSRQLTARLQQTFPVGTTEAALKATLQAQGFKPLPPPPADCVPPVQQGLLQEADQPAVVCPPQDAGRSLKYEWGNGSCGATIWVRWSTDHHDTVTLLDGYYYSTCL